MIDDEKWGAGDKSQWRYANPVTVGKKEYPFFFGEHPHSRSDNSTYVDMGGDEPAGFNGNRILIDINLKSENYLKDSYLSGAEIRKGGSGQIIADGEVVFEFFYRDIQWALLRAHHLIEELMEHSSDWLVRREREKLVGRKIYYREISSVIERLIVDQGCMIIRREDGKPFPPPVYRDEDEDDERETVLKVDVLDHNIWWFRN